MHELGGYIGGHAHVALATTKHQCHGGGVVSGIHGEVGGGFFDEPLGALNVAGGFLNAHNAGHFGQAQHRLVRHVCHSAARYVVKNDRKVYRLSNGGKVKVLAFLSGLVVIGHHLQLAIGPYFLGKLSQFNGLSRGIGATAGHDGHFAGRLFHCNPNDFAMLFHIHRGGLSRSAHHANAVCALCNMPINQLAQGGVVHLSVGQQRGHQSDDAASNRFKR